MSEDLTEFLRTCIAEDDDAAKRAAFGYGAGWTSVSDDAEDWSVVHADGERDMVGCEDPDVTRHIARHDPARVLAECDAKRRIVEAAEVVSGMDNQIEGEWGSRGSVPWSEDQGVLLLRLLTLPYADRPGFREEWRP